MILGMIKNVTYTGDVLMQKTYSGRDYRRRKNNGERAQYYADGHHEGIIDHETFERANEALRQRGLEKGNRTVEPGQPDGAIRPEASNPRQNRYAFSGKLVCGCCGTKMKRITGRAGGGKRFYWGCSAHAADLSSCGMKREQEDSIRNAFTTMLNKLAFAPVADLYIEMLEAEEEEKSSPEIEIINRRQQAIIEEKERLTLLLSKGCGEPALFYERVAALDAEATALEKELDRLSGESRIMQEAQSLKKVVNDWKSGHETYADKVFTDIADHATVNTGLSITFHLKCGLELTEALAQA